MKTTQWLPGLSLCLFFILFFQCEQNDFKGLTLQKESRIVLVGNNLGSRMMNYGHFETALQLRYPDSLLFIRNMCDGGNTSGFRPHSGRNEPWAFPGAAKFQTELATESGSIGHFESPDEWLHRLKPDIIIAFFGSNESFQGPGGLENFKGELEAFIQHTLKQQYNGKTIPQLALVSPIAFEDLSDQMDVPNGIEENENLRLYTEAIEEVAQKYEVHFLDVFSQSLDWYQSEPEAMTIDGSQMNSRGYERLAVALADGIFGKTTVKATQRKAAVTEAVLEKNWFWHNDFKIPNGVHVFGRRYKPFGPDNYPAELKKIREMAAIRDTAIWKALKGEPFDLQAADARTTQLPPVATNYEPSN